MKPRITIQIFLGALLALALAFSWNVSFAQRDRSRHFPETGHTVEGEFLKFYESFPNAELVFGYPISRPFDDRMGDSPRRVQYFQQARFELVIDDAGNPKVMLSKLGELLYDKNQNRSFETSSAGCKSLVNPDNNGETFQICYAFLDFFETHGGLSVFGYPISNFELEHRFTVQYFENAIMVWHPEMPSGQMVQLVDVGSIYFSKIGEDQEYKLPPDGGDILGDNRRSLLDLKVRAFTEKALVSDGGQQTLYVIVQDQKLQPVEGAQVKFILDLPNGETMGILMPPTDENGITKYTLSVDTSGEVGQATFEVIASILNHENHTRTSFRIWW